MKINESGRSMIEMLGVLAIIGVLSVGGIAGYSKAMAKFRSNKTIDQVSHIVANTRILFGSQRDYSGLDGATATGNDGTAATAKEVMGKAKLLPDEMTKATTANNATTYTFTNAYAGSVALRSAGRMVATDSKAFVIVFTGIPQEACIDLASQDWSASSGSGFVALTVTSNNDASEDAFAASKLTNFLSITYQGCEQGQNKNSMGSPSATSCGKSGDPMSVLDASSGCSGKNFNTMYFKFY